MWLMEILFNVFKIGSHVVGQIFFLNTVEEPKYAHFVSRICDRCFIWEHTLTSLLINCTMMMQECTFTIIIFVVNSQGLIRIIVFLRHLFSELEVLQSNKCISRSYKLQRSYTKPTKNLISTATIMSCCMIA